MNAYGRAGVAAVVAAMLGAGLWSAQAQAQFQPRPETGQPRPGESYEPIGVPVGGFRLFPVLEVLGQYDSNIFATDNDEQDDFITVVRPSLNLRSNWNNHMLNLFASAAFGFYSDYSSENYTDARIGFSGRLDIQRNWYLFGGLQFAHLHEDRADPNATSFGSLTEYNQISGNVGYYQKFNRFSVRLEGRIDDYTYTNNKGATLGTISNADRDRRQYTETLRLAYEFIDRYEIWVQGGLNQRVYDRRVDSAGLRRGSDGWEVIGGATIDFGGITQVDLFAGYTEQRYDDARLGTIRGPMFGLTGYWNPLVPLVVRPYIKRSIEETILIPFAGYWSTAFGVTVDYEMRPNIRINSAFSYTIVDYKKARGFVGAPNRNDDYIVFEIGLRYLPTENFFLGPSYQFSNRDSNLNGVDFHRHLFSLRLGARL